MTVWYTKYTDDLVNEVIDKTSIEACSLNLEGFRDFLFVKDNPPPGYSKLFSAYIPLGVDIKISEQNFIKKCIELYPTEKGDVEL